MVKTMAKLRMAHASTHGARKPPGPKIDSKEMSVEKFELKDYFKSLHLSESRDKFRLRSFMTRTVKTNFSSDKQFSADLWSC